MKMDNSSMMRMEEHPSMEMDNHGSFEMDNAGNMDVDATDNNALAVFSPTTPSALTYNNELVDPDTQPNKRRRKKSIVWEHFTIETVGPGCTKACCKHCKKSFAYITGSKLAGTSHLKRHIALGICPVSRQNNTNQLTPASDAKNSTDPPKKRYRASPGYVSIPLDQQRCNHEMAKMIIMHEYPLHMVEHAGFTDFVRTLQPQFNMASFNTIHGDCVSMYLLEKQKLLDLIGGIPGRVNVTLDMWTSNQSVGYVFLTGHFIDSEWKLQRRLLNVVLVPSPDSDTAFCQPVAACLSDWNLERKLSSLTVDQSTANETAIGNLRGFLSVRNPLVLNGQLLIGNCYARLISRLAQDTLGAIGATIKKVRDSVKYVKANDSHEDRFFEVKRQLQVPSTKDLSIDDQTKWNTTFNMLVAASELKEVFSCLETCDPDYRMAPSADEWKQVEILCVYLKLLFDAANILTGLTYPMANTLYHEVTKVQLELTHAAMSKDPFVSSLTKPLKEKFDKYWNDCFLVLSIAVVMDPRFKMKLIEFSFSKIYGEDAGMWIKTVDDGIHELYHDYTSQHFPLLEAYVDHGNDGISEIEGSQAAHVDHSPNGMAHGHAVEGLPQEGYTLEGLTQEDNPPNGQSQDQPSVVMPHVELLSDGQPKEGDPPNGQPSEDRPSEQPQEDHMVNGQPREGHMVNDQPQEDHMVNGQPREDHMVNGQPREGHMVNDQPREGHPENGQPQEGQPMEALAQEGRPAEAKSQEGRPAEAVPQEGRPAETLVQEGRPVEALPQEGQPVEALPHEDQPAEALPQEGQRLEALLKESQAANEPPQEGRHAEGLPQEGQHAEGLPQVGQQIEGLPQEGQETEGLPQEGQDMEGLLQEDEPPQSLPQESLPAEGKPGESQHAERQPQESQPADGLHQGTKPVEGLAEVTQTMEAVAEETQPMEELKQESQPTEGVPHDTQPMEELTQETQSVEGIPQETQPMEELSQEVHPEEGLPQEVHPAERLSQEVQHEEGLPPGQDPSDGLPHDGHASDSLLQEGHPFGLPHDGHPSDVLLQEGHHLEASSQEFPLITIEDGFSDFELYISEITSHQEMKSELDQYLEESLVPRSQEFDILGWWKLNRTKYPTLSKMAADILSMPFSTVTPDSVFDTKPKKMDNYRSSLRAVTLEALICAKDWFPYGSPTPEFQTPAAKMESRL